MKRGVVQNVRRLCRLLLFINALLARYLTLRSSPDIRWYRAPEIFLADTEYTTAVDIWSCACVLGGLLMGGPVFGQAEEDVDYLANILKVCGVEN